MAHDRALTTATAFAGWRIWRSDAGRYWATRAQPFGRAAERARSDWWRSRVSRSRRSRRADQRAVAAPTDTRQRHWLRWFTERPKNSLTVSLPHGLVS
jgi:hypothetical protein